MPFAQALSFLDDAGLEKIRLMIACYDNPEARAARAIVEDEIRDRDLRRAPL